MSYGHGDAEREERGRAVGVVDGDAYICYKANMSKAKSTMTKILRATIRDSGLSAYRISKDTGLVVTSIIRFVQGETSLRLDKADVLAEYFGLNLVVGGQGRKRKETS